MIVKICGMRDPENIRAVEQLKPTWMGFICWSGSKRFVDHAPAYLPQCERVGVFVDAEPTYIYNMVHTLGLHRIQLHGNETPERCRELARDTQLPIIKAISVSSKDDIRRATDYEEVANHLLFDTKTPLVGGSGEQFDWSVLEDYQGTTPFLLSGGIGPADAPRLAHFQHPAFAGIDLNSRFEDAPAMKNVARLSTFLHEINAFAKQ
ncbi:MAG: phosphoribosylanthranilate isomerase [Bacteroidales bacterium]|nr:phosphoribosylanthranilate isomerase [Candidatus Physcousia equi]